MSKGVLMESSWCLCRTVATSFRSVRQVVAWLHDIVLFLVTFRANYLSTNIFVAHEANRWDETACLRRSIIQHRHYFDARERRKSRTEMR